MQPDTTHLLVFMAQEAEQLAKYGEQRMLSEIIPWERATMAYDPLDKKYYEVSHEKWATGELLLFLKEENQKKPVSKEVLAWSMDLFDKDGRILHVMWLAL